MKKLIRFALLIVVIFVVYQTFSSFILPNTRVRHLKNAEIPDWIDQQIIEIQVGDSSRTGKKLEDIKNIVVHYVGNPGSTAQGNRDFFASSTSDVSSHFVVGLEGEIIQCVPLHERSSASNWRNKDTISIEVCHPTDTGEFNPATYDSLVKLTKWLCETAKLDSEDVIRHYDITGKECPRYFVNYEDAWVSFKNDVKFYEVE